MSILCRTGRGLLLLALLSGCGKDPEMAEVEGTVKYHGKPLAKVEVVFLPDPEQGTQGPRSTAITDDKGHYRLLGDNQKVGAVVGNHRVTVAELLDPSAQPLGGPSLGPKGKTSDGIVTPGGDGALPPAPAAGAKQPRNRVPTAYASATLTPLRKEVKSGPQTIDLELNP